MKSAIKLLGFSLIIFLSSCVDQEVNQVELTYLDGIFDESFTKTQLFEIARVEQESPDAENPINDRLQEIQSAIEEEIKECEAKGLVPDGYEIRYTLGVEDGFFILDKAALYVVRETSGLPGPRRAGLKRFPSSE